MGSTPYPGMEANADLFTKLVDGYRLSKPKKATQEVREGAGECVCLYGDVHESSND